MEVKLHFTQISSSQRLTETFYVTKILNQYKNNNKQKKVHIKQLIQDLFQQDLFNQIILDHFQVRFKNKEKKLQSIKNTENLFLRF